MSSDIPSDEKYVLPGTPCNSYQVDGIVRSCPTSICNLFVGLLH